MRRYKILLSFLFIIFYLLWLYFSYESFRKSREVYLADINITIINLKEKTSIDFLSLGRRRVALAISVVLIIASFVSLATRGLNFGIDFTGGVLLEVGYPQEADLDDDAVQDAGPG